MSLSLRCVPSMCCASDGDPAIHGDRCWRAQGHRGRPRNWLEPTGASAGARGPRGHSSRSRARQPMAHPQGTHVYEHWVKNSFICVHDQDQMGQMQLPVRRKSQSVPPLVASGGGDEKSLAPRSVDRSEPVVLGPPVPAASSKGGRRCQRCRGRKGARCRCALKRAAAPWAAAAEQQPESQPAQDGPESRSNEPDEQDRHRV
ncbi:unnamed protein product [Prorocentrum cordatum]|uniref:Uncharacterized protein n=1 Tax=Prorocentrum cordatum TaxID=2364126 RepID=A0ABN9VD20_9DINO|nr:unnamed protein product [Polarella glacialis]